MEFRFIFSLLVLIIFINITSACYFPTILSGTYLSSSKGSLEFGDTYFSGYAISSIGSFNFSCQMKSDNLYVVKSESFNQFGMNFNAYLCMELTQVTRVTNGDLYYYYVKTAEEAAAGNERVVIWLSSLSLTSMSEICTATDNSTLAYSMLMKDGTLESVKTECPIPFLGNFAYTYDTGSGDLCSANDTSLTVCDDKITMTFNYTQCSQIQAYSAGGVLSCIHSYASSDTYTVHVYNNDTTTDESTTYRFTCYTVTGYDTVYATQSPQDCQVGQNTSSGPTNGAALVLTSSLLCAYATSSSEDVLSAGVIAGICIVIILILIACIVAFIWWYKKKREREEREKLDAEDMKVDPEDLSPDMRLGLPTESKYDLDRLMYTPEPMQNGHAKKKTPRKAGESSKTPLTDTDGSPMGEKELLEAGEKGEKGYKGDKGKKGGKGVKVVKGKKGGKGYTGEEGDTGEEGENGDKGGKGYTGEEGDTGEEGENGDKGDKGKKGYTGDNGYTDDEGDNGDTGEEGDNGDTGEEGDNGDTGEEGDNGDTGEEGDNGGKGYKGYKVEEKRREEKRKMEMLEAAVAKGFQEKMKRKDNKDEFTGADNKSKQAKERLKNIVKGRLRRRAATSLEIKLKTFRPKRSKSVMGIREVAESRMEDGRPVHVSDRGATAKEITVHVEESEIETRRKTRFADNPVAPTPIHVGGKLKTKGKGKSSKVGL